MKTMEWIDLPSLKMLALALFLNIYANLFHFGTALPLWLLQYAALAASITTIGFNIYRFIDTRIKKNKSK